MKRKIVSVLLAGLMAVSLAACDTGKTPVEPNDPGQTIEPIENIDVPDGNTGSGDWTLPEVNW